MNDDKVHRRFLLHLVVTFVAVAALCAGMNVLIDPYALFGSPRIAGLNDLKPSLPERVRTSKPYMATRVEPRTVVGGNSRPEMGLNPQSPCWGDNHQPVFNASVPGMSVLMQTTHVQHAVEAGNASNVFLGLDFLDFLIDPDRTAPARDRPRMSGAFDGHKGGEGGRGLFSWSLSRQALKDHFDALFSLVTLADSINTLAAQRDPNASTRTEHGFNPALDYRPIIRAEGQAVLFAQKNMELRQRLEKTELRLVDPDSGIAPAFEALEAHLTWAAERDVRVTLFINPYHSDYLYLIRTTGQWPLFEAWQHQLARLADDNDVPLWDFNAVNAYTTEQPQAGTRTPELKWFWEPAHYRKELGDIMLASMLERDCVPDPPASGFSTRVDAASLEVHLARLSTKLDSFIAERPTILEHVNNGSQGLE